MSLAQGVVVNEERLRELTEAHDELERRFEALASDFEELRGAVLAGVALIGALDQHAA